MVSTMAFLISLGKLFVVTVFAYLLIGWLAQQAGAPEKIKLACQIIIVLIAVLSAIGDAVSLFDPQPASALVPSRPLSPSNPSIIR